MGAGEADRCEAEQTLRSFVCMVPIVLYMSDSMGRVMSNKGPLPAIDSVASVLAVTIRQHRTHFVPPHFVTLLPSL